MGEQLRAGVQLRVAMELATVAGGTSAQSNW